MMTIIRRIPVFLLLVGFCGTISCAHKDRKSDWHDSLQVNSDREHAQIEVGGPYVGIEMHHSSPAINRISFYYPVANSLDLSTDYWHRDTSRVMFYGLRIGEGPKEWIDNSSFPYRLTPYSVTFKKQDHLKRIEISYRFCNHRPAMVAYIKVTNTSSESTSFELYTHMETSLRSCHTYKLKDRAWTDYDGEGATLITNYEDPETGNAQIFITNAGIHPYTYSADGQDLGMPRSGRNRWMTQSSELPRKRIIRDDPRRPASAYVYRKILRPGKEMEVIQIIGSCGMGEADTHVAYLLENYQEEVDTYEQSVLEEAFQKTVLETGDEPLDHSVYWAKAISVANVHYLNGYMFPMPCPAEYNFFFTHDVLLTDLAIVLYDVVRVKQDLEAITGLADEENTIPHAYYWKDDRFRTEYAGTDNWNHFWFVLLCARYLRHTGDLETIKKLYPYIFTSIERSLKSRGEDGLMWADHPDWWDIGKSRGPRAYTTLLAIRTLRAFVYISSKMGKATNTLVLYENLATHIQGQLNDFLWDDDLRYFINYYDDNTKDSHLYIGPLLGVHFGVIDPDKIQILIQTATEKLLDGRLGIYNAVPMDFHILKTKLRFVGDEMGDPYYYMNGGIWPHGNAWYALALIANNQHEEAVQMIRNTLSVKGIAGSPGGQPAMYEFRSGDLENPSNYGKVDKPQFLWAGGWYLYALYYLLGVRENIWNISLEPYVLRGHESAQYTLIIGSQDVLVHQAGRGRYIEEIRYDGKPLPTAVIPEKTDVERSISIRTGSPNMPYLASLRSALNLCRYEDDEKTLQFIVHAFPGFEDEASIVSPVEPKSVFHNGKKLNSGYEVKYDGPIYILNVIYKHQSNSDTLSVLF